MLSLRALASLLAATLALTSCSSDGDEPAEEEMPSGAGPIAAPPLGGRFTTTARLNLREQPSKSAPIKLTIPKGATVVAVSRVFENNYYRVDYDGNEGFTFARYLEPDGTTTAESGSALHVMPR